MLIRTRLTDRYIGARHLLAVTFSRTPMRNV
ncbi:hypothetical protein M3J09_013867 [Ascochyta lentis]